MDTRIIPRSFGTHDGSFHADEVTACATLLLFGLIDRDKVYRTRDPNTLARCEYVCDVGGIYEPARKRFDHHQVEYAGGLSSAGMLWKYLKEEKYIEQQLYDYFNTTLIIGIDAHDNGVARVEPGYSSFSQVVSNFLPVEYNATEKELQDAFFQALFFVLEHLDRLKRRFLYTLSCREKVRKCMAESTQALVFNESLPWMENFFDLGGEVHPALFVIMPTGVHWKLRGIPPSLRDRMRVRRPLPQKWAGLHEGDLQRASGIPGAIFCHKGRFISIWKTREDALRALRIVLMPSESQP